MITLGDEEFSEDVDLVPAKDIGFLWARGGKGDGHEVGVEADDTMMLGVGDGEVDELGEEVLVLGTETKDHVVTGEEGVDTALTGVEKGPGTEDAFVILSDGDGTGVAEDGARDVITIEHFLGQIAPEIGVTSVIGGAEAHDGGRVSVTVGVVDHGEGEPGTGDGGVGADDVFEKLDGFGLTASDVVGICTGEEGEDLGGLGLVGPCHAGLGLA